MATGMGATFTFQANGIDNISGPASNAANSLRKAGTAAGGAKTSFGGLSQMSMLMPGAMGGAISSMGMMAATLGPIGVGIGAAIAAYRAFNSVVEASNAILADSISRYTATQTKLAEVQTILGVTTSEMRKVQDATRGMANAFGTTSVKQLEGFYQTASAGFPEAGRAAEVMTAANKLAVGGVADLFQTVDLLTTILNGYQISTENALEASDTLFQTVKYGKTTVSQLAGAFGKVVPGSAAAGVSLEEAASAMATLTLAGQSTDEAATALARAFDFLVKKPKQAMKVMAEYGVEEKDLDVRSRGLLPVIQSIGKAFEGNEEALVTAVPQIRAFRAILPLATTMSEKFSTVLDGMNVKAGATDKAFGAVSATLEFQQRRWDSFMGGLRSKVGEVFAPAMAKAIDIAMDFLSVIDKLPQGMKNVIFGAVGVGLALPTLLGKITSLAWAAVKLGLAFSVVFVALQSIGPFLGVAGAAFAPFLARVIRFATAWKQNIGGMQDKFQQFSANFKIVMEGLGEALTHGGEINAKLGKDLESKGLLPYVGKMYAVLSRVQGFIEAFWKGFSDAALAGADSLDDISPGLKLVVDLIKSLGDEENLETKIPFEKWTEAGKDLGESIGGLVQALSDMKSAWVENEANITAVLSVMGMLFKAAVWVSKVFLAIVDAISWIIDKWDYISTALIVLSGGSLAIPLGAEQLTRAESPLSKLLQFGQSAIGLGPTLAGPAGEAAPPGTPGAAPALRGAPQQVKVQMTSNLVLDGEKVAKIVQEQQFQNAEDTFTPWGDSTAMSY